MLGGILVGFLAGGFGENDREQVGHPVTVGEGGAGRGDQRFVEHVLHMVGPGHTFAEIAAIGGFACPAHAEAIAPTTCELLPLDRFRKEMATDHQLCLEMMTGLCFWVRHLISLMEDLVLRDAVGRLASYLLESDSSEDGTVRLPGLKRHIASHLNLTSETFSRTLRRLVKAGLIEQLEGGRLRILRRDDLKNLADGLYPVL